MADCLKVLVPNGVILSAVNLAQIGVLANIAAAAVSIAYAVWRWRRDRRGGR